jgi:hypothetical protein
MQLAFFVQVPVGCAALSNATFDPALARFHAQLLLH